MWSPLMDGHGPSPTSWLAALYTASSAGAVGSALLAAFALILLHLLRKPLAVANVLVVMTFGFVTVAFLSAQVSGVLRRVPFQADEAVDLVWWIGLFALFAVRGTRTRRRRPPRPWQTALVLVAGAAVVAAKHYLQ